MSNDLLILKNRTKLQQPWFLYGLVAAVAMVFIGIIHFVHFWRDVPIKDLTRDPIAVFNGDAYIGFLSQSGIFLWAAAAAICLFTAYLITGRGGFAKHQKYLIISGLLTLLLGLDDIFLLHESFFPFLGVPEEIILITYVLMILAWLIYFRSVILKTENTLLFSAFIFFGLSMTVDVFSGNFPGEFLVEDGAKFVGILFWLTYFFSVCTACVSAAISKKSIS